MLLYVADVSKIYCLFLIKCQVRIIFIKWKQNSCQGATWEKLTFLQDQHFLKSNYVLSVVSCSQKLCFAKSFWVSQPRSECGAKFWPQRVRHRTTVSYLPVPFDMLTHPCAIVTLSASMRYFELYSHFLGMPHPFLTRRKVSLVPSILVGSSQLPGTAALESLLDSAGTCAHLCTHPRIHTIKNKSLFKLPCIPWSRWISLDLGSRQCRCYLYSEKTST